MIEGMNLLADRGSKKNTLKQESDGDLCKSRNAILVLKTLLCNDIMPCVLQRVV